MTLTTNTPRVTLTYDDVSDSLYIDACKPYKEQDSDEIGLGLLARTNPTTKAIESIEVRAFRKRLAGGQPVEVPLLLDPQTPMA
jgi:hypothetical protein